MDNNNNDSGLVMDNNNNNDSRLVMDNNNNYNDSRLVMDNTRLMIHKLLNRIFLY